ncbi:MAG: bifunctional [glutamate--ammonia ligase]-adenylyl-L-tyrosine phosphorylase/[glutamate--ammonia-ligase] adenylyltransferase [Thiohalomonadales bacterium]
MPDLDSQITAKIRTSPNYKALQRALTHSPFASRLIQRNPAWLDDLVQNLAIPWDRAQLDRRLESHLHGTSIELLKHQLRTIRNQVLLRTLVRDVGGLANLQEVMSTMTILADFSIQTALKNAATFVQASFGKPEESKQGKECQMAVIAMGKLGGGELNVSSDIDIFFAYPFDGNTNHSEKPISHQEYFNRVAKQFIHILDDITEDGFVFRVDTRLRPFGGSGQLVCSFDMLTNYYQTHGRDWERYALIKARIITGNSATQLLKIFKPFIYRNYLDYNAIDSLRNLKTQIMQEVKRKGMRQNVKLGAGGIREIEFIVQAFQLIRGGRQVKLQTASTLGALREIKNLALLDEEVCQELQDCYIFLRKIEHRIQYDQDRQTHTLPKEEDAQARLIQLSTDFEKVNNWQNLLEKIDKRRDFVKRHFNELLHVNAPENKTHIVWSTLLTDTDTKDRLGKLGYQSPQEIQNRLQQIRTGRRYKKLPDTSKHKFDLLAELSIENAAKTKHPDRALIRSMNLLENISGRSSYLALFIEHPQALQYVHNMVADSPFIANLLSQYPLLLDTLLDERILYQAIQKHQLEEELQYRLKNIEQYDIEMQMDLLREFKQSYIFKVAAQEINKTIPLIDISDSLSLLADVIIKFILRLAWLQMNLDYAPKFLVVAYGKLGSRELSYSSDLDIVFLFDNSDKGSMQEYIRYSQRINHWLSTYTSAGILYQTDLRLRPDGSKGLLAIPIDSFESYQNTRAWNWEHQALTKARCIAGDENLAVRFNHIRNTILSKQRDLAGLKKELLEMRARIKNSKPSSISTKNIKNMPGGIIDIEFVVQYLILAHAHDHHELLSNTGNIALLQSAVDIGIIPAVLAKQVASSYQNFRQILHDNMLLDPEIAPHSDAALILLSQPAQDLWQLIFFD